MASGATVYRASAPVYQYITGVVSPQGALALVAVPHCILGDVALPRESIIACASGVQDPGNLGSLIRTSAAAGCAFVCTTPGTVSARNPKAVRASAGTFFRIPVVEQVEPAAVIAYAQERELRLQSLVDTVLDTLVDGSDFPTPPKASYRHLMSMTSDYGLTPHAPGRHYAYNNEGVQFYGVAMDRQFFDSIGPVAVLPFDQS